MKSPTESLLAVSYFLPEISFIKRKANLYRDESGYLFFEYSGEAEIQKEFDPDALTELLKLIPVKKYIYDENGKKLKNEYELKSINPHKITEYLNRFGVIGISDINFRNEILMGRDLLALTRNTGLHPIYAEKLYKGKMLDPKFLIRLKAIQDGDEVPYKRVENILKDLARSARLYLNLLEDPSFKNGEVLSLTDKNRKRIVSAWNRYGGAFEDSEDPADPKFNLREEWTNTVGSKKKISPLDFAEGALSSFALVMNEHLNLISKSVVTTQGVRRFNQQNTGLEVAFSAYLVNAFKDTKVKKICVECGSVFLPIRVKEENKYCGEVCSKKVRNRNYRKKKKVSASKAGKKATTKARKETK